VAQASKSGAIAQVSAADAARAALIRKVLDEDIRPYVKADGGDIEFAGIEGNVVKVRLHGACGTCPSSTVTLRDGVQARLRAKVAPDLVVQDVPAAK
jgi:NifU-like protein